MSKPAVQIQQQETILDASKLFFNTGLKKVIVVDESAQV